MNLLRGFLVALSFLTVLPIRFRVLPDPSDIRRSRFWFPVVSLLLALLLGAVGRAVVLLGSPALGAFFLLVVWIGVTGALHLDGFCDLCDGLFGGHDREERLRIMKDPHVGTFGLAGGFLLLLGKFVALQELIAYWPGALPWLVGAAVLASRCLALWLAAGARYPRPDGTGKILIHATSTWEGWLYGAVGIAAVAAIEPLVGLPISFIPLVSIVAVTAILRLVCQWRLGGVTGDCLGAGIESVELVFLLTAALPAATGLY